MGVTGWKSAWNTFDQTWQNVGWIFMYKKIKNRLKDSSVASNYNTFLLLKVEIERLKTFEASRIKTLHEKRTLIKAQKNF